MNATEKIFDYMYKHRKTLQLLLGLLVAIFITVTELKAQSAEGFIYGKVYTSNDTYVGQIRWGKEEAYWNDHFNTSKVDNLYSTYKSRQKKNNYNFDWRLFSIWDDRSTQTVHLFSSQFGDLQEIINYRDGRVVAKLKNGEEIRLSGSGYNDVGSSIRVLDQDLGLITVKWDRIRKVEFLPTPKNLKETLGKPIYGTVETYRKGKMTGFIQWDHDERIGTDKLDGDTRDGEVSIAFDKIGKIENRGNSSQVYLKSGRSFQVSGSNDVNDSNKGIIVTVDGVGKVDIPWRAFKSVTFEDVEESGDSYSSYKIAELKGKVRQYRGGEVSGKIIFDLDEEWNLELLEGMDDELEYKIPFRNIKRIAPKNYNYAIVELKNGVELLLGDSRDVTESNAGILVFDSQNKEPLHIEWKDVTEIIFE